MLTAQPGSRTISLNDYAITCLVNGEIWKQNTYIVLNSRSGERTVIDPGDNAPQIIQYIVGEGGGLQRILLTHAHFDHVGAASELSKHFGLPCQLHRKDVRLLMHAPMYALRFSNKILPAVTSFEAFDESGPSAIDDDVKAIHTPGHTLGSTCYLFDGFVFTGDTLLFEHIGRTDLPGGDPTLISRSIDQLLNTLDESTTIFPGHDRTWNVRDARVWWSTLQSAPPQFDGLNV